MDIKNGKLIISKEDVQGCVSERVRTMLLHRNIKSSDVKILRSGKAIVTILEEPNSKVAEIRTATK